MTDPRDDPKFKHQRHEDKVVQLLGAILDALKEPRAFRWEDIGELEYWPIKDIQPGEPVTKLGEQIEKMMTRRKKGNR